MKNFRAPVLLALAAAGLVINGCNATGGIDSPGGREENLQAARIKLDANDCNGAIEYINKIDSPDNEVKQVLGWAQLCQAGATISKVGNSLFNYNSSTNNLTVVGDLANSLIPSSQAKVDSVTSAIVTFGSMTADNAGSQNEKGVNVAFGNLIRASVILAKASRNGQRVLRTDIGLVGCLASDCTTAPAACSGSEMSDADATAFTDSVRGAGNAVAGLSGLGAAADIANRLVGQVGAANLTRCAIVNNMLTQ